MICKKCKKTKEKKLNKDVNVEWNIPKGIDAEHQVQMIGLTKEDLRIIHNLQPFVNEQIDDIVNRFYENLENEPSLLDLINDNSSIEKLRKTLRTHITEMFNGVINQEYFERRIRIAHIHVQVGLKTKWYLCAFQDLLLSLIGIIEENFEDKEEYFLAIKAVSKILNLEQQLVLESYDIETERIRKKAEDQKNTSKKQCRNGI